MNDPQSSAAGHDRPASPQPTPPDRRRRSLNPLRWVLLYTRGLVVDQYLRRITMFYTVLAAMLMFFGGDLFLDDWLDWKHHLSRFLVYWLVCGWLTVLAALLAIYDLVLLRVQHRLLRRELHRQFLERERERGRDHDNPPGA